MNHVPMRRGFTIVELLVTIGIIALLMSLLMGGIGKARSAARASREMSDLRQLHVAWTMYADQFGTACLPGVMTEPVQEYWKLKFRAKSKTTDQDTGGTVSDKLPRVSTQTYPWRLMPFLDYSWDVMMDYRPADGADAGYEVSVKPLQMLPGAAVPSLLQTLGDAPDNTPGRTLSMQPAYGYNAFYIGGVWRMPTTGTTTPRPRLMFGDVKPTAKAATAMGIGATASLPVVMQKVGGARYPDQLLLFCPSAFMGASATGAAITQPLPGTPGAPYVAPPMLGTKAIWQASDDGTDGIKVLQNEAVPLSREASPMPFVTVDGTTATAGYGQLRDMRHWIDVAKLPIEVQFDAIHADDP
jgi:prepilin-type N-terminal cleavage/methylation domain-containing protein